MRRGRGAGASRPVTGDVKLLRPDLRILTSPVARREAPGESGPDAELHPEFRKPLGSLSLREKSWQKSRQKPRLQNAAKRLQIVVGRSNTAQNAAKIIPN